MIMAEVFNPDLPQDHALIVAAELRNQFTTLKAEIDAKVDAEYVATALTEQTAGEPCACGERSWNNNSTAPLRGCWRAAAASLRVPMSFIGIAIGASHGCHR
jgi:hypothetical protein